MKQNLKICLLLVWTVLLSTVATAADAVVNGKQPNAAIAVNGTIRVAFGKENVIYTMASTDNGQHFSAPEQVAILPDMQLGMARGPQIASSKNYSLITAMDKAGNIYSYQLNHSTGKWTAVAKANDTADSAPEGLMALTADDNDRFYAVWLDIRGNEKNKVYFSSLNGGKTAWAANKLVYTSPDESVCECCKPNITFNHNKLTISFRNWLNGSRDIYYTSSTDKGKTFTAPEKFGQGTWKLEGCPMDGGGLAINDKGQVSSVWQRKGEIFFCQQNQPEQQVATGRSCALTQTGDHTSIVWQQEGQIKLKDLSTNTIATLGKGNTPRVYTLANGKTFCLWENDGTVQHKVI
ncbi:sialidase family protein [Pontibacter liquoris]|uniref:sialidase family protein n=1 Tax=Pontibacter liquoris TaxID=2905677 RepID=UPI001FA7C8D4|nr:sialidase family protein [Pontibacter liquoris]